MRNCTYLIIFFLCLTASSMVAQDNLLKDYAPVAPTAAALGKYGDIPVTYHTGLPNISIPIYALTEGSVSVSVGLNYHASGIKVEETASWVGLGWALNAGGVITRTVQGAPDERGNANQTSGYYANMGNGMSPGLCIPFSASENGAFDLEPDIFNFNIGGMTGKFFFDKTRKIHVVPQQDILIEPIVDFSGGNVVFNGWIITDPQGVRYHFAATDGSMNKNDYIERTVSGIDPTVPPRAASWYMSKIESADRKDVIQFTYTEEQYGFWNISAPQVTGAVTNCLTGAISQPFKTRVIGKRLASIVGTNGSMTFTGDATARQDLSNYTCYANCSASINSEAKALKTIQVKDKAGACLKQFDFAYSYTTLAPVGPLTSTQLPPDDTDRKRLVLNSVTESACGSMTNNKVHSFDYFDLNAMPRRVSAAQDHWGYYNGMDSNTDMAPGFPYNKTVCNSCSYSPNRCTATPTKREPAFPAMRNGTLKKITYPTGGSSTFDFEAHTVWGTDTICTENNISANGLSAGSCQGWNQWDYTVSFSQQQINAGIKLELIWSPYSSSCTYNGHLSIDIKTSPFGTTLWSSSINSTAYYSLSNVPFVANQPYTIHFINDGGKSDYRFYYLTKTTTQLNKTVGGLRVKSITTNDGDATTSNNIIRNFNYHNPSTPTRSSARVFYMPLYTASYIPNVVYTTGNNPTCYHVDNSNPYSNCPAQGTILNSVFSAKGLQPMQTVMGSHIGYEKVSVSETGNGKTQYTYNIGGTYATAPWTPTGFPYAPPPFEPLLGTLAGKEVYSESGTKLQEILYEYLTATNTVISGLDAIKVLHVNYEHTGCPVKAYNLNTGYALLNWVSESFYNPDGTTFIEKITTISYSPSNGHLQKTSEEITDSDGTVYRTKYKYPKDYTCQTWPGTECDENFPTADAEGKVIYAMRKRNIVAIPIEQTTWIKRPGGSFQLTGATYFQFDKVNTSYDNIKLKVVHQVLPMSPLSTFTESTVSSSGDFSKDDSKYKKEYNYLFSNTHGKILSEWKENDPAKKQYIWGHNEKLLLAKVINAEDTEVAFTSFEESNATTLQGNWAIDGATGGFVTDAGYFLTGRTGFNTGTSRTLKKLGLPAGTYVVSGWYRDGQIKVNGSTIGTLAGSTWQYAETTITIAAGGSISVTGSLGTTHIDELRLHPADAFMRTSSYDERNQLVLSIADENSVPGHFEYDNFQRQQIIRDQDLNILQTYEYNYQQAGTALNDIKSRTVLTSGQTTISAVNALTGANVLRVFQYMDGLGRPIQTNAVGQSPSSKDIISINEYDQYGREPKKYIPYTITSNSGAFRASAVSEQNSFAGTFGAGTTPFAQSVFESSPLNRVTEQGAPGDTWKTGQGANAHTIRLAWQGNSAGEAVHDFTNGGNFGDNKLLRTETKDENGKLVYTYTDKLGRIVLVKKQLSASLIGGNDDVNFSRTYTVYDDFGRVVAIIPPEAAKKFKDSNQATWNYNSTAYNSMVFIYSYDDRGRLISKSIPSGGITSIAYDRLDRPVLATDAKGFKIFTRYDVIGRPIVTGRYKGAGTPGISDPLFETPNTTSPHFYTTTAFPTDNNLDVYKVIYYDDYDVNNNGTLGADETYTNPAEAGHETAAFLRTRGKPTVAKVAILKNDGSAPSTFLSTRTYYDKKYNIIQINKQNHLNGTDISSSAYDFAHRITKTRRDHTATPLGGALTTHTIRENYTYDHAGRMAYTYHQINNQTKVLLSKNTYDELNRLKEKNLHCSNFDGSALPLTQNYLQSLDYTYNIRGWMTGINDVTTCTTQSGDFKGDMFKMALTYESTATGGTAQYNGNISTIQWNISTNTTTCSTRNLYRFSYDGSDRLTGATYLDWSGAAWTASNKFTESNINYDLNGNLKSYNRNGLLSGTSTFGLIDQLTYTYGDVERPDRLTQMADAINVSRGFKPFSPITGNHYVYDNNGNMTQDKHKNFVISYNHLNLPTIFSKGANFITITYTADGEKLTKDFTFNGTRKDYVSGIEYSGSALAAIYHAEGRLTPNGTNFYYEYTLKDYLGSARVNFRASGTSVTFLEDFHYYPFGMKMEGISAPPGSGTSNKYQYNQKELNDDENLELYDYGARWYDPAVGRWWSVDPLGEETTNWSPYNYGLNNPISNIDPTGMSTEAWRFEDLNSRIDAYNKQIRADDLKFASWLDRTTPRPDLGTSEPSGNAGAEQNEDCCPGLHTWLVMNGAANPNGASAHILGGEMGVIDVIAGTWGMFIHPVETVKGTLLLFSPMDITSKIQLTLSLGSAYQAVVQGNGFERGRVFGNILGTAALGALGEVRVLGFGRGIVAEGSFGSLMEAGEAARYAKYWQNYAPKQITPGITRIDWSRVSGRTSRMETSRVIYDNYGRQIYRVDFSDHMRPSVHSTPHLHQYQYGPMSSFGHESVFNFWGQ